MVRRTATIFLASALTSLVWAEQQERKPAEEITNSLGMRRRYVPPGEFATGSPADVNRKDEDEMPRRQVRITKGLYMGRTEVMRSQFAVLVTDAEWEYACRAGGETVYEWGDRPEDGVGWCNVAYLAAEIYFSEIASPSVLFHWSDGYAFTAPAGRFRPNAFGLYDMQGNVLELG